MQQTQTEHVFTPTLTDVAPLTLSPTTFLNMLLVAISYLYVAIVKLSTSIRVESYMYCHYRHVLNMDLC